MSFYIKSFFPFHPRWRNVLKMFNIDNVIVNCFVSDGCLLFSYTSFSPSFSLNPLLYHFGHRLLKCFITRPRISWVGTFICFLVTFWSSFHTKWLSLLLQVADIDNVLINKTLFQETEDVTLILFILPVANPLDWASIVPNAPPLMLHFLPKITISMGLDRAEDSLLLTQSEFFWLYRITCGIQLPLSGFRCLTRHNRSS